MNSSACRKGFLFALLLFRVISSEAVTTAVEKEHESLSERDREDFAYWRGLVEDLSSVEPVVPSGAPTSKLFVVYFAF
jgi:hypothetical protein